MNKFSLLIKRIKLSWKREFSFESNIRWQYSSICKPFNDFLVVLWSKRELLESRVEPTVIIFFRWRETTIMKKKRNSKISWGPRNQLDAKCFSDDLSRMLGEVSLRFPKDRAGLILKCNSHRPFIVAVRRNFLSRSLMQEGNLRRTIRREALFISSAIASSILKSKWNQVTLDNIGRKWFFSNSV